MDLTGRRLGAYVLERKLGQGGMGAVYVGRHSVLDRERAIKVLLDTDADASIVERLRREALVAASLRHPNIVEIMDVDERDGIHYIVMDLVEGHSLLEEVRADGAMPMERVLHLIGPLADALDYAHGRGVVHRDIKPSNVIVGADDQVTLVDFGIARASDDVRLTQAGMVVGTFEYMAPELVTEGGGTGLSDLYSLGIVAYQMLTGQVPFTGSSAHVIMYAQVHKPPPPPRSIRPDLAPEVDRVLLKQLAKEPAERYQTGRAFVDALADAHRRGATTRYEPAFPQTPAGPPQDLTPPPTPSLRGPVSDPGIGDGPRPIRPETPVGGTPVEWRPTGATGSTGLSSGVSTQTPPPWTPAAESTGYTRATGAVTGVRTPPPQDVAWTPPPVPLHTVPTTPPPPTLAAPQRKGAPIGVIVGLLVLVVGVSVGSVLWLTGTLDPAAPTSPAQTSMKPTLTQTPGPGLATQPGVTPAAEVTGVPAAVAAKPRVEVPPTPANVPTVVAVTPAPTVPTATPEPTAAPLGPVERARAAAAAGNHASALRILEEARVEVPGTPGLDDAEYEIRLSFAESLAKRGNHDAAIAEYEAAAKIRPGQGPAEEGKRLVELDRSWAQMEAAWDKDDRAVRDALERMVALDPDYRYREGAVRGKFYSFLVTLGDRQLDAGEREAAAATYQRAIEINSDGVEARAKLLALTPTPTPAPPAPVYVAPPASRPNNTSTGSGTGTYRPPTTSSGGGSSPSSGGGSTRPPIIGP